MAWLSVGETNDDLCDKLLEHGVLQHGSILNAFRNTDRGDFVQQDNRSLAYADRPFRHEHVHISAPHMYATVLEQLELSEGLSFLNIGSGSGYFSCLAACLLGERGLSHGIDVNSDTVKHSEACCQRWYNNILLRREAGEIGLPTISREGVSFVEGNCFDIDVAASTACCRYDRIYVGAGCPENKKEFFFSLLADEGVMVAPIDDSNCLVRIRRQCRNVYTVTHVSHVHFAPLVSQSSSPSPSPSPSPTAWGSTGKQLVRLPPVLWAPVSSRHKQFPTQFRDAVHVLLLASRHCSSNSSGSGSGNGNGNGNGSSVTKHLYRSFPVHIWTFILSFASRDWFVPYQSESELLTKELLCERKLRAEAEDKLKTALAARVKAERERDIYKLVLHQMNQGHQVSEALHDAEEEMEEEEEEEEEEDDAHGDEEEGDGLYDEEMDEEMDEEEEDEYLRVHSSTNMLAEAWHLAGQSDEGTGEDDDDEEEEEEEYWESSTSSSNIGGTGAETRTGTGTAGAGITGGVTTLHEMDYDSMQQEV